MKPSVAQAAVPILVLGESRRRHLIERVTKVVTTWHTEWASEGVESPVVELTGSGMPPRAVGKESVTLAALVDGEPLLFACSDADFVEALCVAGSRERLFPTLGPARGRLESTLTGEAVHALCLDLMRAALPSEVCSVTRSDAILDHAQLGWARRATGLTIRAGGPARRCSLEISAAPRFVDALLGRRPNASGGERLVARRRAAEDERVSVTVTLGSASISWCELRSLSVGDAILLDQPLEAPCTLSVKGSTAVAEAHLGRAENSLAVQITRILPTPQEKRGQR